MDNEETRTVALGMSDLQLRRMENPELNPQMIGGPMAEGKSDWSKAMTGVWYLRLVLCSLRTWQATSDTQDDLLKVPKDS